MENTNEFLERAKELVAKMTLDEKFEQLRHTVPPISRLGVHGYNYWNECLHGVARAGEATVFPQCMAMAATFDDELVLDEATAISYEGRAKFNQFREVDSETRFHCLTFCSPNINIFRDPRWGRGQETFGEDPYLTSKMGAAFVKGLQGDGKYHRSDAILKHFAVHSGPEADRHCFDARPTKRDLYGTYLRAFKYCIDNTDVAAVMGAYNRLYGEACGASKYLIGEVLRGEFGYKGLMVSDYVALDDLHGGHKLTNDSAESAALAIKNGLQLEYGNTFKFLREAYDRGLINEDDITAAVEKAFETRFRLGLFDRTELDDVPYSVVCCKEYTELNRRACADSIVLLKNDGLLPLGNDIKSVAVVGPNAKSLISLLGNYNGSPVHPSTLLDGIYDACEARGITVRYNMGCDFAKEQLYNDGVKNRLLKESLVCARNADLVILCLGLNPNMEGEEGMVDEKTVRGDKGSIELPAVQLELLETVAEAGKPMIAVNMSGSCVGLSRVTELCGSVLQMFYPGAEGGIALAKVLFGEVNPAGRLPVTFYHSTEDLPDIRDYSMDNRTYRFYRGKVDYPFGYGLSYTKFEYSDGEYEVDNDVLKLSVNVKNVGKYDGKEAVQCYAQLPYGNPELFGFKKIALKSGESQKVTIEIPLDSTGWYDDDGKLNRLKGETVFYIGGHQPDARSLELTGTKCVELKVIL